MRCNCSKLHLILLLLLLLLSPPPLSPLSHSLYLAAQFDHRPLQLSQRATDEAIDLRALACQQFLGRLLHRLLECKGPAEW